MNEKDVERLELDLACKALKTAMKRREGVEDMEGQKIERKGRTLILKRNASLYELETLRRLDNCAY